MLRPSPPVAGLYDEVVAKVPNNPMSPGSGDDAASAGSQWLVRLLLILGLGVMIALAFLAATAALIVAIIVIPIAFVWAWARRVVGGSGATQRVRRRAAVGADFFETVTMSEPATHAGPSTGSQRDDDHGENDGDRVNVRVRN